MCNWQSPNSFLVEMLPVPFTSTYPSLIFHLAGSLGLVPRHSDKSFPLNRMIASAGGGPGSTIRGSSLGAGISAVRGTNFVGATGLFGLAVFAVWQPAGTPRSAAAANGKKKFFIRVPPDNKNFRLINAKH